MRKLFRLKKNQEGVTAIEFAILAPVFFLLFLGIIEVGLTVFVDSTLNTALREVARKGISQELDSGEADEIFRKHMAGLYNADVLEYANPSTQDSDTSDKELKFLREKSAEFIASPGEFFSGHSYSSGGKSGKLTVYVARVKWGGFSKLVAVFLPDYLYAVTVVRNEDYDSGGR